jgi:hypothetical protein
VFKRQGKHGKGRSVIVYEGDPAFNIRKLLADHIAWRRSQGASDRDYLFAWPDGSFPVLRDALNTVLTKGDALVDPMTGERRVAYSFRHSMARACGGRRYSARCHTRSIRGRRTATSRSRSPDADPAPRTWKNPVPTRGRLVRQLPQHSTRRHAGNLKAAVPQLVVAIPPLGAANPRRHQMTRGYWSQTQCSPKDLTGE